MPSDGCATPRSEWPNVETASKLASRKGFEPLTYGLGNRCSILLSYRDACETV